MARKSTSAKRTEATIIAEAKDIMFWLEPEVLHCDGEISRTAARRRAQSLRRQFKALEVELGRKITEFGSIDGMMPATMTFGRPSAKDSGWKVGDKVSFNAKGTTIVGHVKRVNVKTISVMVGVGPRYWRVSPGLLRAA